MNVFDEVNMYFLKLFMIKKPPPLPHLFHSTNNLRNIKHPHQSPLKHPGILNYAPLKIAHQTPSRIINPGNTIIPNTVTPNHIPSILQCPCTKQKLEVRNACRRSSCLHNHTVGTHHCSKHTSLHICKKQRRLHLLNRHGKSKKQ